MANILFGSSNVYRNYAKALESGLFSGRDFRLVRCTKKTVFDAHLAELTSASLVVTSVLENFISEVCKGVPDDEVLLFAHQQITAHVEALHQLVVRLPEVTVVVCPPMYRSVPSWFGSYLPAFNEFLTSEVVRLGTKSIGVCPSFVVLPSYLEADGVHLSPAGGERFLTHLDAQLRSLLIEVPSESSDEAANPTTSEIPASTDRPESDLALLAKRTSDFEAFVRRRFKNDDFVFARLKEEADSELNKSKENRVVITGLPPPPLSLTSHSEKKKYYVDAVTRLVTLACASLEPQPKVLDVYINLRKDKGQPLVEVKFDSVSGALAFRHEGVSLAKAEHAEFATLFFSNAVTQATRIRIEILKALSKKLTTTSEFAYVQGFISRPMLQYKIREGARSTADGTGRSYNFVDAIAKFSSKLSDSDLSTAYVRAGSTFSGSMSQYFVVLKDSLINSLPRSSANRAPLGRRGGRQPWQRRGLPKTRGHSYADAVVLNPSTRDSGSHSSNPDVDMTDDDIRPPPAAPDRGTKRPGDPHVVPSKRNESELNISE